MADIMTREQRSRLMSRIRGKDTKLEVRVRKALHALGLRYRLGGRKLPGKPDLVFPRFRAVVFIHGCFWHRHDCHLFQMPETRRPFWEEKIGRNQSRDLRVAEALQNYGWRQCTVWECAVRGRGKEALAEVAEKVARWVRSDTPRLVIPDTEHRRP